MQTPFDIIDRRIDSGMYHAQVDYPTAKDPERAAKLQLYREQAAQGEKTFKADLLTTYNLQDHPKGEKALRLAWEIGHSQGFYEVLKCFDNLAELLQD